MTTANHQNLKTNDDTHGAIPSESERIVQDLLANRVVFSNGPRVVNLAVRDQAQQFGLDSNSTNDLKSHRLMDVLGQNESDVFADARVLELDAGNQSFDEAWKDAARIAQRHDVQLRLTANADLLEPETLLNLIGRVNTVSLNLESHVEEIATRLRPGMNWSCCIENLGRLASLCSENEIGCVVNTVFVTDVLGVLPDMAGFLAEIGIRNLNILHFVSTSDGDRLLDPLAHYSEPYLFRVRQSTIDASRAAGIRLFWNPGSSEVFDFRSEVEPQETDLDFPPSTELANQIRLVVPGFCPSVFERVNVKSDGHVTPCPLATDGELVLGDLGSQSFLQIWNGETAQDLRRAMYTEDLPSLCQGCKVREPVGLQEDMPFTNRVILELEPAIFSDFISSDGNFPESRTLFLRSPEHLLRAEQTPNLAFHSRFTGSEILLAVALGGQGEEIFTKRIDINFDEHGNANVPFPMDVWDQMQPNLAYWYALWQICDGGQPPARTEWVRCVTRHQSIPRVEGSAVGYQDQGHVPSYELGGDKPIGFKK